MHSIEKESKEVARISDYQRESLFFPPLEIKYGNLICFL